MANGSLIITEPVSTETPRNAGPEGRRRLTFFVDGLLLLTGCAAFAVSRNVATTSAAINGAATIDDIWFWFVGLVPIGLMFGLAVTLEPRKSAGHDWLSRRFIAVWIVTLGAFCVSRDFQLYKVVYQFVQTSFSLGQSLTELGTAATLSMIGTALVLLFTALPYLRRHSGSASAFLAAWLATSVMLYGMLLRGLPPY